MIIHALLISMMAMLYVFSQTADVESVLVGIHILFKKHLIIYQSTNPQ